MFDFEDFKDLHEKVIQMITGGAPVDPEQWTQCGKINPEDLARRRGLLAKANEKKRESDALEARIDALKAGVTADSKEWWAYVYKTYGLPEGDYTILDDGRIMMRPKKDK